MVHQLSENLQITAPQLPNSQKILTPDAQAFLIKIHKKFNEERKSLLKKRQDRQKSINEGELPKFLQETSRVRNDQSWSVAETPKDLQKRFVEITGPTERKMMINALNSGADVFMADFEDALSPTWSNVIEGQFNLIETINGNISFTSNDGKEYRLKDKTAVLMVRPRGLHLYEKHVVIDGESISASLFDFGLYFFHNAKKLLDKGSGPYFYIPKLESHLEARWWNEVFITAQEELGIPRGSIRATVLVETILAAFEMEEILFELKEHAAGLNAGRWDYIFSIIKKFSQSEGFVLPDRVQITMTVPFMRAYTELLVKTCHKRKAHAIGGMAAYIPSRKDKEVNDIALKKVQEDKIRESKDGFDGTWVAHPDLVPIALEIFKNFMQNRLNQKERLREDVKIHADELLDFRIPGGKITEQGLRQNINVGLQYLEAWLRGQGAVALYNLMEDTATVEISRAQIWQWIHQPNGLLNDGRKVDIDLVNDIIEEELQKIKISIGQERFEGSKFELAKKIFQKLLNNNQFEEFLTLIAYKYLE